MSELLIRQYKSSDKADIFELHVKTMKAEGAYAETGDWDKDFDDIEGIYLNNKGEFIVGILNDKIVASGALKKITDETVELKRMRVVQEFQHQGIGQQVLNYLEIKAKDLGYKTIQLDTLEKQSKARKFYEKNGYKEFERKEIAGVGETIFYRKII